MKRRLCEIWHKLSRLDDTPDQIASGFSTGICAIFLPLKMGSVKEGRVSPFRLIGSSGPAIASRRDASRGLPRPGWRDSRGRA